MSRVTVAELQGRIEELQAQNDRYTPIIASLAIYGEGVNLPALVEKVRSFPEVKRAVEGGAGIMDGGA